MSNPRRFSLQLVVTAVFLAVHSAAAQEVAQQEIMTLSEVEPGMRGEWHTVISGTEIEAFPFKVIGVGENFVGPKRSIILCEALDEQNLVTGPVSGMSGSPVYIDGKLIGAYAYGFNWAKEQALFGVTPIEDMLDVWEWAESEGEEPVARRSGGRGTWEVAGSEALSRDEFGEAAWRMADEARLSPRSRFRESMWPLPTPLFVSGISPAVLAEFEGEFRRRGVELESAPVGRGSDDMDTDLAPGSAVAGMLMTGDFTFAATGTVTHRVGDRILAFGHPFLGEGDVEIPMAPAEIMTVVQSAMSSFKLSNPGPVIGSIHQDRASAIAGTIGRAAPVTEFEVRVRGRPGEGTEVFRGELFENQFMSPLISATALMEALIEAKRAGGEKTLFIESRWEIEGEEPIVLEDAAAGTSAPLVLASDHLYLYDRIVANPFEFPRVERVTFDVTAKSEQLLTQLESVQIDRTRFRAGGEAELLLRLRNYRGEESIERVRIPVPEKTGDGRFTIFVGDAPSARSTSERRSSAPEDLSQLLDRVRDHYSYRDITIRVLESAPGLALEGQFLPDLPPSVGSLYGRGATQLPTRRTGFKTLWEKRLTVDGEFRGSYRNTFSIER